MRFTVGNCSLISDFEAYSVFLYLKILFSIVVSLFVKPTGIGYLTMISILLYKNLGRNL